MYNVLTTYITYSDWKLMSKNDIPEAGNTNIAEMWIVYKIKATGGMNKNVVVSRLHWYMKTMFT